MEAVAKAEPDGYTLLLISPAAAINATLYDKLNYNFLRDVAPIAGISRAPNVMQVHPRFQPRQCPSSSPIRERIRTKSTWPRPESGRRRI